MGAEVTTGEQQSGSLPPPSAAPCLVYTSCPPSQLWPLRGTAGAVFPAIMGIFSSYTTPRAAHYF